MLKIEKRQTRGMGEPEIRGIAGLVYQDHPPGRKMTLRIENCVVWEGT